MNIIRIVLPAIFIFWTGCGGPSDSPPPISTTNTSDEDTTGSPDEPPPDLSPGIETLVIVPSELSLPVGGVHPVSVEARDEFDQLVNDVEVVWSVSDPTVAGVAAGEVTGLKEGEAVLTASYQGILTAQAPIRVVPLPVVPPEVASIDLIDTVERLIVGGRHAFRAAAKDSSGTIIQGVIFTWSSSDSTVAGVDPNGLVTALRPGEATITVSAEGAVRSLSIAIDEPQSPTARLTASPSQGNVPLTVRFDGRASSDPDGTVAAYEWDFGDGASAAGPVVDHIYRTEGIYTATLKVTDDSGRAGAAAATIDARTPPPPGTCAPVSAAGWEIVRGQEPLQDLWGVHFVDECEGWTVGMGTAAAGSATITLAHTADGGKSWERQGNVIWKDPQPEIPPDLYDVFFLDKKTGWAAGWPEVVLSTTDGGATWIEQRRNAAYTQNICVATDASGTCTKRNWCDQPDPENPRNCLGKKSGTYLRRIRFADAQNGWVVGRFGTLYRTVNGGATWTHPPRRPTNPVDCAETPTRPVGEPYTPHWFGLDVQSAAEIWISGGSDDGTWCAGWNRVIIHTTDGGSTWISQNDHPDFGGLEGSGRYQDIRLIGNAGWAVGEVGTILRTTDHGLTWKRVSGIGAGGATLWGLSFIDPSNIWITGSNGVILHSENGGASWCKQESGTGTQLRRSSFVNPNYGWAAGQFRLFRTTTGGKTQPCLPPS